MPEAGGQSGESDSDEFDQAEMVRAFRAAHEAGLRVSASMSGPHTAIHALENLPEFGRQYRTTKEGKHRAKAAILALIRNGQIERVEYTDQHRNKRERLELAVLTS
ncbi:hypothetical protein FQZ97_760970 [compost metagenome]